MKTKIAIVMLLLSSLSAYANQDTCNAASKNLSSTIPDWMKTLRGFDSLDKNKMVKEIEIEIKNGWKY